jgi:hypothetical protein
MTIKTKILVSSIICLIPLLGIPFGISKYHGDGKYKSYGFLIKEYHEVSFPYIDMRDGVSAKYSFSNFKTLNMITYLLIKISSEKPVDIAGIGTNLDIVIKDKNGGTIFSKSAPINSQALRINENKKLLPPLLSEWPLLHEWDIHNMEKSIEPIPTSYHDTANIFEIREFIPKIESNWFNSLTVGISDNSKINPGIKCSITI